MSFLQKKATWLLAACAALTPVEGSEGRVKPPAPKPAAIYHYPYGDETKRPPLPGIEVLKANLLTQLAKHKITPPVLFQIEGTPLHSLQNYYMQKTFGKSEAFYLDKRIYGVNGNGETRKLLAEGIYGTPCQNFMVFDFTEYQYLAGTHEFSHHVDSMLGITAKILDKILQKNYPNKELREFVSDPLNMIMYMLFLNENIADTSSTLYMLSNHGARAIVPALVDFRLSRPVDAVHTTATSIRMAVAAFQKAPQKNMDIVQTTQMAGRLVDAAQDALARDFLASKKLVFSSPGFKANHRATVAALLDELFKHSRDPLVEQAKASRDRLCGLAKPAPGGAKS